MRESSRFPALLLQVLAVSLLLRPAAQAQAASGVRLFRLVTMRGSLLLGFTAAELAALGPGTDPERIARRIADAGEVTAWRYAATRAADGSTRLATQRRVTVRDAEALTVEPCVPLLPVVPPPA